MASRPITSPTAVGAPGVGGSGAPAGPGAPGGRAQRIDPRDKAQLAASPVSLRRVAALFAGQRGRLAIVVALIVATSLISLAQPFLVREVVDVAIPRQDVRLLVAAVLAMIGVAVATSLFGVLRRVEGERLDGVLTALVPALPLHALEEAVAYLHSHGQRDACLAQFLSALADRSAGPATLAWLGRHVDEAGVRDAVDTRDLLDQLVDLLTRDLSGDDLKAQRHSGIRFSTRIFQGIRASMINLNTLCVLEGSGRCYI